MGEETRPDIVGYLLGDGHCACDFNRIEGKDQTTMSRHLNFLTEAEIAKSRRRRRRRGLLLATRIEVKGCRDRTAEGDGETFVKESLKEDYGMVARAGGMSCCGGGC